MKKFFRMLAFVLVSIMSISLFQGPTASAVGALPDLYNPSFTPTKATVLTQAGAESNAAVKVALVRQPNQKVVYMIKDDSGIMQPFYSKAIETGFWDTRMQGQVTDWNTVFQNIKNLGANTVQVMVHWSDWNPQDGVYDYTFMDDLVSKASAKGLKINWVIFFHYQWNMDTKYDNFWAYHLEDRNGANYSIQWGTSTQNNISTIRSISKEVFPEYWHPDVYAKLMSAISNLATHYKDSKDVIAYQLGNEEGFNYYLNNGNDSNPYYAQLFTKWKTETGKTDEATFRKETFARIWQNMTDAVHKVDPYKPTLSNLQGGEPEKSASFNWNNGCDSGFYNDACLDMAGPMFYGTDCYRIWSNMDSRYNYTNGMPILYPSEIGASGTKSINLRTYLVNSLERGAQGFGIYCYGEMLGTIHETNTRKLLSMINASEDIIHAGIPVTSASAANNAFLSTTTSTAKISNLDKDAHSALGMLYFPDVVRLGSADTNINVAVNLNVKNADTYTIQTYIDGALSSTETKVLPANGAYNKNISMSNYSTCFIKVTDSTIVVPPAPIAPTNIALNKTASADSQETANPAAKGNDGSDTTRWCAANGNTGHWWKVDLGQKSNISGTEITWEKSNAYKYRLEVSDDNTAWTVVSDKTANTAANQTMADSFTASARYVRITITGGVSSSIWPSFYELKVLGDNTSTTPVFPDTTAIYQIVNRNSGKALNIVAGSTADGANLEQYTYGGWQSQQWQFISVDGVYYKIKNILSGKIMNINSASTVDGANNIQSTDTGVYSQQWQLIDAGNGYFKIKNRNSGKVLEISGASTAEGALSLQQTDNTTANSQQWSFVKVN